MVYVRASISPATQEVIANLAHGVTFDPAHITRVS